MTTNNQNSLDDPTNTMDNIDEILQQLIVEHDQMLAANLDDDDYFKAENEYYAKAVVAINKTIMEAQVEELERLKVMLAGFTWGPYDPFNIINTRITELTKKYGRADNE